MNPQQQALSIIRTEHQTLTAVVDALRHVAGDIAQGKLTPDYKLLWSILYYIEEFPDKLHHPKEDDLLFPKVRLRCSDINDTLDDLGRQHVNSIPHLAMLKGMLGRMEAEIPGAMQAFCDKVNTYASFHYRHMTQEESIVLPKAIEVLQAEDWQTIAEGFSQNTDPVRNPGEGSSEWFRQFYRRIVTLVPEPWGVGARR